MRKINYLWMLMLLFTVSIIITSCTDDKKEIDESVTGGDEKEDEKDPEDPQTTVLGENTPTPIASAKYMKAEGGNDGVTINVLDVKNQTFVFTLEPGKYVQSYKLDVYPLSILYNYLYESKKLNPNANTDDLIIDALFAGDGSGGFNISPSILGSDWDKFELD